MAHEAACQGNGDGDAGRRGDEVADRQPGHLGQEGHRRLAGVVLPVRVRVEADRGVVREVRRNGTQAGLVERQRALEPLLQIQSQDAHEGEDDHRDRIGGPALLLGLVDSHDAVDAAFQRPEHRPQEGALTFHDLAHVPAEGPHEQDRHAEERDGLDQAGQ